MKNSEKKIVPVVVKKRKSRLSPTCRVKNSPGVQAVVDSMASHTDPMGSYTGVPTFGVMPEQDADDL
ncbi:MAG: hypothetical protein LBL82_01950 [Oscillospiraceae bacterium]|jgi:hypothetical protein|nr:hypothetical protein [Oscillospiraceae bacterium]